MLASHTGNVSVQKGDIIMKRFVAAGIAGAALALALSFGSASAAPAEQQGLTTAQPSGPASTSPALGSRHAGSHGGKEALIRATASVTGLTC
jgi:hypothetical protein